MYLYASVFLSTFNSKTLCEYKGILLSWVVLVHSTDTGSRAFSVRALALQFII